MMSRVLFDALENVRVSFLLPGRQVVPVSHIGWLWIWEVLKDLADPTESYKASLLRTGELRGTAVCSLDKCTYLIVYSSSTLPFPIRCFLPRRDVARLSVHLGSAASRQTSTLSGRCVPL
jgi:hypothetical protein